MGRKARGIMQNQQGLSMILVLCIGAVLRRCLRRWSMQRLC